MREYNFDGIVGPNHCYAGMSPGNLASEKHRFRQSNPRAAALQGLQKMQQLHNMGFAQAMLPPLMRPSFKWLQPLGLSGDAKTVNQTLWQHYPDLALRCYSSSAMWTANAATITASPDSADGRTHLTVSNLQSMTHRSIEPPQTAHNLKQIFADDNYFCHHAPLPSQWVFSDEGAANHTRLCPDHSGSGVNLYVYNQRLEAPLKPQKFVGRQSYFASKAIANQHQTQYTVFAQQNPKVVDLGVFHNDVIAVGSCNLLLCHQYAFVEQNTVYQQLQQHFDDQLAIIEVKDSEIDVQTAVATYLFNSQLLRQADGCFVIAAPIECQNNPIVRQYLHNLIAAQPLIANVIYFNLTESMDNGGGPACLRLRVPLSSEAVNSINANVFYSDKLHRDLEAVISSCYRDKLCLNDFRDDAFFDECQQTIVKIYDLMGLQPLVESEKS